MIRVVLPYHLRKLAQVDKEVSLQVDGPVTARAVIDALEATYPTLRGTIRDYSSGERRPLLRFFACGEDLSHDPADTELPEAVATGDEPFLIIGAIAGGRSAWESSAIKAAKQSGRNASRASRISGSQKGLQTLGEPSEGC